MKYFVIAKHFDETQGKQVNYIAGQFNSYVNASIFMKAYNDHYSSNAYIIDEQNMMNTISNAFGI